MVGQGHELLVGAQRKTQRTLSLIRKWLVARSTRFEATSELLAGAGCQEKQTSLRRVKCFYLTSPFIEPAHEIFAGGKKVKMEEEHVDYLRLRDDLVTNELQHDLDKLGIAKNSREEKKRARDAKAAAAPVAEHRGPQKNDEAYNARMASLYREVVLKEKPAQSQDGFIPLGALAKVGGNGNGAHAPKPEVPEPVAGELAFSFWLSGMGRRAGDPFYLHDEAVAEIKTRSRRRLHRLPTLAQNARMGLPRTAPLKPKDGLNGPPARTFSLAGD